MNKDVAQVYKSPDGFRWRIIAANGETIAQGEAYNNKADVLSMLQLHFPDAAVVELDEE